jgi:hypothetical protein
MAQAFRRPASLITEELYQAHARQEGQAFLNA